MARQGNFHRSRISDCGNARLKLGLQHSYINGFITRLLRANSQETELFELDAGKILGPTLIKERPTLCITKIPADVPLFVGKIRTDITSNTRNGAD
jgi:hypothetical protein